MLLVSKKEIGGNHVFFRDKYFKDLNYLEKNTPYIAFYFMAFKNNNSSFLLLNYL